MIPSLREVQVAVVGGGIIGLSIAYELAQRRAHVRVFEQGEPAQGASWAGAGMLAPFTESVPDAQLLAFMLDSLERYPVFVASLAAESGIDPRLRLDGILNVASDENRFEALQIRARELGALGRPFDLLTARETRALEPALRTDVRGALMVRSEGQIDNRRLGRALLRACERTGVEVQSGCSVTSVEADARRVLGVRTSAGFAPAEIVINAAGAWASQLQVAGQTGAPEVTPVKGQMLSLEIPRGFMQHVTWADGVYFVPRNDGKLLVGATVESAGFEARPNAQGISQLLNAALCAAPSLRTFSISEMWAGLRPATADGRPYVGATAVSGYYLATGHYRNGILLAPATAALLCDVLEGKENVLAACCAPLRAQPETAFAEEPN